MSTPAELAKQSSFDAQLHMRLVFGNGKLSLVGGLAAEHGASNVLLVTDPGIRAVGHVDRAQASLEAAGLAVAVYDRLRKPHNRMRRRMCGTSPQ